MKAREARKKMKARKASQIRKASIRSKGTWDTKAREAHNLAHS